MAEGLEQGPVECVGLDLVFGVPLHRGDEAGIAGHRDPFDHPVVAGCLTVLRYLILPGLYVGALVVVYGIINLHPPKAPSRCPLPCSAW